MIFRVYCGRFTSGYSFWGQNPDGYNPECGAQTDIEAEDREDLESEPRFCSKCGGEFCPIGDLRLSECLTNESKRRPAMRVEVDTGRSLVVGGVAFRCSSSGNWHGADDAIRLEHGRRGWTWRYDENLIDTRIYKKRSEAALAAVAFVCGARTQTEGGDAASADEG